jgi:uncharacterized membrane protein
MIWIVTIVLFLYLLSRISQLEHKLSKFEREEIKDTLKQYSANPIPKPASESRNIETQTITTEQSKTIADHSPILTQGEIREMRQPLADHNWEANIGGKFFTVIGAVAILFGLGFFLKYAFDHNLISPVARVFLGLVLGGIFVGLGQYAKKKYTLYGHLLAGLGLGVFYLSIYASFSLYHLVSQTVAFAAMILVTVLGTTLAIKDDSEAMAGLAQFGGFITPLILTTGGNHPHTLFGYLILLDIGILIVNYLKPWQTLSITSLLGTSLIYAGWFGSKYTPDQFGIAFGYITAFFVVYFAANLIHYFRRRVADEKSLLQLNLNTLAYFGFTYLLMNHLHHSWLAPFAAILGLVYLGVAFLAFEERKEGDYYGEFLLALSFLMFFIAIPVQFHKFTIGIAWGAEALVLVLLGFKMRTQSIRYLAHAFFIIATIYTIALGGTHQTTLWLNTRFLSSMLVTVTLLWALYIYWMKKSETDSVQTGGAFAPTNEYKLAISVLGFEAYALFLSGLSIEISSGNHGHWWLPIIWALGAFGIGAVGAKIKNEFFRVLAYITLLIVAFRLLFAESVVNVRTYSPVFNSRVLAFLLVFGIVALFVRFMRKHQEGLSQAEKDVVTTIFFANNILLLTVISMEVLDFFSQKSLIYEISYANAKNVALSVTWILYAAGNLILGIISKKQSTRIFALMLFALSIIKVFLYDSVSLNNFSRFISYITLGVILLFSGYLYNRYKDRILQFIKASE